MILIFICYIAYFAFTIFIASFDSQLLSGFAVDALPAPISVILSFFIASHIWIAVVLAFLNFAVSFAAYYFSGKSIQNHFISLLSSAAKPVLWMTILFTVSMIIGYIAGQFYPELFDDLSNSLVLPDGSAFSIMLHIFFNNVRVVFMLIFLGFVLGFLPIMIVVVNGFAIGIVSEYIIRNESFLFLLTGLAPHGIIEIPIILLGAGVGYSSGMTASHVLVKNKTFADFKQSFINATWIFCLLVVPLLFVAAIIEVYVTGALLGVAF